MANKKDATPQEAVEETAEAVKVEPVAGDSEYPAEEFIANADSVFGVRSECVAAALKTANVTSCTIPTAKKIVEEFMAKEVK